MIGCPVQIQDEVKFVGNKAKNGGALYIISFAQLKVFPNTTLTVENNKGRWAPKDTSCNIHCRMYHNRIGASIVVLSRMFSEAPPYNRPLHNPHCFLLHLDLNDPFSSVNNVSVLTINILLKVVFITVQVGIYKQHCIWSYRDFLTQCPTVLMESKQSTLFWPCIYCELAICEL